MTDRVLYTQEKCVPCRYLEKVIKENNIQVTNKTGGYHPLVNQRPTLIIDNASAIVGVIAIEKYFKTHMM